MTAKIHKFYQAGQYIVVDVHSGAVHRVGKIVYDLLDCYDGENVDSVKKVLCYEREEIERALAAVERLRDEGRLWTAPPDESRMVLPERTVKALCLNVAHDCNLRCRYCFAATGGFGGARTIMDEDIAVRAVDFLFANNGGRKHCEIDFFGGEPLLNMPAVKSAVAKVRLLEKATGKQCKLTLTTNASLITDDDLKFLNDEAISLVLSCDGRPTVHDSMRPDSRGGPSYDLTMEKIQKIVASRQGINYYVRGTYTAENLDFTADVLWLADIGLKWLSVEPVVSNNRRFCLEERHLPQLMAEYEKLTEEYVNRKQAGDGFDFFHFNIDIDKGPCLRKVTGGCGAGFQYFAVSPDGGLYPCHQFVGQEQFRLGDIFAGIKADDICEEFCSSHIFSQPDCRECWARYYCGGGCHANNFLHNGDIRKSYHLGCELHKKRVECALTAKALLNCQNI